jgi:hypothetical protein
MSTPWTVIFAVFTTTMASIVAVVGPLNTASCLMLLTKKEYWQPHYNKVEFAAYAAKAAIILPGLIFGLEIWWLHFITLATSITLIWVSERKLLPTLILFNTVWIFISTTVVVRHLVQTL